MGRGHEQGDTKENQEFLKRNKFTDVEIGSLLRLKNKYLGGEILDTNQLNINRLNFARWMAEHGKINESGS